MAEPIFLVEKPVLTVGENNNFYINGIDSNIEYVDFYDEDDVYIALNGNWAIGSYDSKIKASVDGSIEVNSAYAPNYDFVVNKNYKLDKNYIPNDLEQISLEYSCDNKYLRKDARINFENKIELFDNREYTLSKLEKEINELKQELGLNDLENPGDEPIAPTEDELADLSDEEKLYELENYHYSDIVDVLEVLTIIETKKIKNY